MISPITPNMPKSKGQNIEDGIFSVLSGKEAHQAHGDGSSLPAASLSAESSGAAVGPQNARAGVLCVRGLSIETPLFMPVGTQATVKGLTPEVLQQLGVHMLLANTYHLHLRPGEKNIAQLGGLHKFMNWPRGLLTDSGGFQVFSLAQKINSISDKGVEFQSHIDGARCFLSPESSMQIQADLGSDIVMAFDECPPATASREQVERAVQRSALWLERCCQAVSSQQLLFGIVQGGLDAQLRQHSLQQALQFDLPGYALGGFSVGEPVDKMYKMLRWLVPQLPANKPRYLMGVGTPGDLIQGIDAGVDMFDCVLPTRMGRTASFWTRQGILKIRNACFARDPLPIEPGCECYTCQHYSRAYLRHLFLAGEMLGPHLGSLHNVHFYMQLMREARAAILAGRWPLWRDQQLTYCTP